MENLWRSHGGPTLPQAVVASSPGLCMNSHSFSGAQHEAGANPGESAVDVLVS